MKLFLISQNENHDYDTYDSAVVCASSESEAKNMHPRDGELRFNYDWCSSVDFVNVQYIGEAAEGMKKGVICASFNAG
jgi:hypothetical protein